MENKLVLRVKGLISFGTLGKHFDLIRAEHIPCNYILRRRDGKIIKVSMYPKGPSFSGSG